MPKDNYKTSSYHRAYMRKYYKEHRDQINSRILAYYYAHREEMKAKNHEYYLRKKASNAQTEEENDHQPTI